MNIQGICVAVILTVSIVLIAPNSMAISRCEQKVLGYNMLITGLATWTFAKLNGEKVGLKTFALGSLAGAGHHYARKSILKGREVSGLAQSYFWASVTENITLGDRPFEYIRYGVGPFSMRAKLSLKDFEIVPEVDALDLTRGLLSIARKDIKDIDIERGMLVGKDNGFVNGGAVATTRGSLVAIKKDRGEFSRGDVIRHEAVHVSQAIQWNAFGSKKMGPLQLNKHIRFGWVHPILRELDDFDTDTETRSYFEREARNNCSTASFTIQKRF